MDPCICRHFYNHVSKPTLCDKKENKVSAQRTQQVGCRKGQRNWQKTAKFAYCIAHTKDIEKERKALTTAFIMGRECSIHALLYTGLIFNEGNGGNCLRCPWSLPWCPFDSPNRNLQIPHRGALCQVKIALPLQVRSIRPVYTYLPYR